MKSTPVQVITLPVRGMTCDHCTDRVGRALGKLPGVSAVSVDLASNQARIRYNPDEVDLVEFHRTITGTGYTLPTQKIILNIQGMSCMSCVAHVKGALEALPGVLEADVQLGNQTAQVSFIPDLVSLLEMEQAILDAGYQTAGSEASLAHRNTESESTQIKSERLYDASRIGRLKRLFQRE